MKNMHGYKVEYMDKQFPTYHSTYEQAKAAAMHFASTTKVTAKVCGITDKGFRYMYIAFGKAPRT